MDCEKILNLFRSELITVNVGPKLLATSLELQGYKIGSFFMDLGGLTDLVFTAGIGEHSDRVRAMVCEKLGAIGVKLDAEANKKNAPVISAPDSTVIVRVIPTDEELGIARRTYELV